MRGVFWVDVYFLSYEFRALLLNLGHTYPADSALLLYSEGLETVL